MINIPKGLNIQHYTQQLQLNEFQFERTMLLIAYLGYNNLAQDRKLYNDTPHNHWHEVHSKTIIKLLGNNYGHILDKLSELKILEINHGYFNATSNHKSRSRSKKYKIHDCQFGDTVGYMQYHLTTTKSKNCLKAFIKYIKNERINTIDLPAPAKKLLINSLIKINMNSLPKQHQFSLQMGPSMDRFGKRFHTAITNLKSTKRNEICLNGNHEPLKEIDIRNCQAYLLSQIKHASPLVGFELGKNKSMIEAIESLFSCKGMQQFRMDLANGVDIYEKIATHNQISREIAKSLFFKAIFGYDSPERLIDGCYPDLETKINIIKNQYISENPSRKWHSNLAFLLQRMESAFVLKHIVSELARQGVDFVLTIHDSFIVKESDAELVEQALKKVSTLLFDIPVSYRINDIKKGSE